MSSSLQFPDSSVGGNSKQIKNVFDDRASEENINAALKTTVTAGVELIPEVGALLGVLVEALWPEPAKKGLVWEDIESKVKEVATDLINKENSQHMRKITEGLYNVMKLYIDQATANNNYSEKSSYFSNIMSALSLHQPLYMSDSAPWDNLTYFASVGTLHLTVLREQALFYEKIHGHGDSQHQKHLQDLEDAIKTYLTARNTIVHKCIEWYKTQLDAHWSASGDGYYHEYQVQYKELQRKTDETFRWNDQNLFGRKAYHCRQKQFETWANTGYRARVEAILSPSFSWPLFSRNPREGIATSNPAHVEEGHFTGGYVKRLMLDYPGWIGDGISPLMDEEKGYFDHEELFRKHGPITRVSMYWGDRIDGLRVEYGGVDAPMCGQGGGGNYILMEVHPVSGNMITMIKANEGPVDGAINSLQFGVTKQDGTEFHRIQCGYKGRTVTDSGWKWSFDGHAGGLKGDSAKRLLWFRGWYRAGGSNGGFIYRLQPVFGHYRTWGPLK
ncbi:hypothetical protein TWF694_003869 [Orbilia ellipsospora]|uniref:Pesticidal crystal protein domain-containing protein n=1 Tax=Orbilia ellipsospora TaxID=2528407 RepID=A0AAV9X0U3_9PEZI